MGASILGDSENYSLRSLRFFFGLLLKYLDSEAICEHTSSVRLLFSLEARGPGYPKDRHEIRLIKENEESLVTLIDVLNLTPMNPALHNPPGLSLPPVCQAGHVPPAPLPSATHSTTTTVFSLVSPDPKTSPLEEYADRWMVVLRI